MMGIHNIVLRKFDPYLNIDAGTMNPLEHGEVFVSQDGTEIDLDIGYYERFTGLPATTRNSTTCGKCLQKVFDKERRGDLLGATVQMTPPPPYR